jgi:hypothetical protein
MVSGRGDQPPPFISAADLGAFVSRTVADTTLRG